MPAPLPRAVAQVGAAGVRAGAWAAVVAQLELRQPLRYVARVIVRLRDWGLKVQTSDAFAFRMGRLKHTRDLQKASPALRVIFGSSFNGPDKHKASAEVSCRACADACTDRCNWG